MTEREDERARHAAAEQASQAFVKAGQERFEVLRQKMTEELEELRNARVLDGKGVATLTEASLKLLIWSKRMSARKRMRAGTERSGELSA